LHPDLSSVGCGTIKLSHPPGHCKMHGNTEFSQPRNLLTHFDLSFLVGSYVSSYQGLSFLVGSYVSSYQGLSFLVGSYVSSYQGLSFLVGSYVSIATRVLFF
jgi:hypothetical protein